MMQGGGPSPLWFIFYDNIICRPFLRPLFMPFLRLSVRGLSIDINCLAFFWQPAQVFIWLMSSGQKESVSHGG